MLSRCSYTIDATCLCKATVILDRICVEGCMERLLQALFTPLDVVRHSAQSLEASVLSRKAAPSLPEVSEAHLPYFVTQSLMHQHQRACHADVPSSGCSWRTACSWKCKASLKSCGAFKWCNTVVCEYIR
eukprot:709755-Amphidinium_carterae.1